MYRFYFNDIQMPITPSSLEISINNRNTTLDLINDGEINILKNAGLTDISFTLLLPNQKYPFCDSAEPANYYLTIFDKLKRNKQVFQFIVTREKRNGELLDDTNIKVSIEDYTIKEDAESLGIDMSVDIKLKEYREYSTKKLVVKENGKVEEETKRDDSTKEKTKTYTVKEGDSLFKICQKQLGNGEKWEEIAKLNGISNANLIKPGQVIKLS